MTNPNVKQDLNRNPKEVSQDSNRPDALRSGQSSARNEPSQSGVKSGSQYDPASKDKKSNY